jgi:hypothetical protein
MVLARRVLSLDVELEIPQRVSLCGMPLRSDIEIGAVFLVRKTRQSENASGVRCGRVAAKLTRSGMKQSLRFFERHAIHFPDHLELVERATYNIFIYIGLTQLRRLMRRIKADCLGPCVDSCVE